MARFGPVITAMVTPFDDDGRVDLDGAAALASWLVEQGNDGLVVTGTTGEASTLTDDEQVEVWRVVRAAVDVPLIAGSGTNDTRHAAELTAQAAAAGIDAVLVVTPYYNRPSQAGLEAHFRHVAGGDRPAGDALRHPDPHRPQDLHRGAAAPGQRGAQHRRRQGRRRRSRRVGPT